MIRKILASKIVAISKPRASGDDPAELDIIGILTG